MIDSYKARCESDSGADVFMIAGLVYHIIAKPSTAGCARLVQFISVGDARIRRILSGRAQTTACTCLEAPIAAFEKETRECSACLLCARNIILGAHLIASLFPCLGTRPRGQRSPVAGYCRSVESRAQWPHHVWCRRIQLVRVWWFSRMGW